MKNFRFHLIPSKVDERDFVYKSQQVNIKLSIDLREWDSLVEDQGDLGSCAGNAMTNCYELMVKQRYPDKFSDLSRLYAYYHARLIEGNLTEDSGVYSLRNMIKGVQKFGLCQEKVWPYKVENYDLKPSDEAYEDARTRSITEYRSLRSQTDMLEALNIGYPVIVGIEIFEDFLLVDQKNPLVSLPDENESSLGGHAVVIIGYDLGKQQFLIKNSFGTEWGDSGYAWLPFEYSKKYVFDRWSFDISDQTTVVIKDYSAGLVPQSE